MVKREGQVFQRLVSHWFLQLALPHRDAMPAHGCQSLLHFLVALLIALYLASPKVDTCLGEAKSATIMAMPEATIHKDTGAVFSQHNVGMTGQPTMVDPISKPLTPQVMSHKDFRPCTIRSYRSHDSCSLFLGKVVHRIVGFHPSFSRQVRTKAIFVPLICLYENVPLQQKYKQSIKPPSTTANFYNSSTQQTSEWACSTLI